MAKTIFLTRFIWVTGFIVVALTLPTRALEDQIGISEIVAENSGVLLDEDGDSSDWFELLSIDSAPVDLSGWHATDDELVADKWTFPDGLTLAPGEFLVVFASGKNRHTFGDELHTNFKLQKGGEYLALTRPDGEVVHAYAPAYPELRANISYGVTTSSSSRQLVSSFAPARAFVPADDSLGLSWTDPDFVDSDWTPGATGVGYETSSGYEDLIGLNTREPMYRITGSVYIRVPFMVTNLETARHLTLRMKYDDGFVAYLNGIEVARSNSPDKLAFDSEATTSNADESAVVFESFNVSDSSKVLREGLNVLAIHGLNNGTSGADMLILPELIAARPEIDPTEQLYFERPTPGAPNSDETFLGFVGDTKFSVDRGFYDTEFDLAITTDTEGAEVLYTTNGTVPEPSNPVARTFDGTPLRIHRTSTIRAAAYRTGLLRTNVDTHTYIFLDDVIVQSPDGQEPPGWPRGPVSDQVFDYGMDPDIVNDPKWGPLMKDALTSISTISLVIDLDNLVNPSTGFYTHAGGTGHAVERPTSVELINPDGSEGFQVDAGIRPRGNFSASGANPKHSFRLFFRAKYGDPKLRDPLFGKEGAGAFDKVDLRCPQNDSWAFRASTEMTFVHDVFTRDLQREMGQAYTRTCYYHVYINGIYWGLYQTQERSEAAYGATYFGGRRDDYDTIKSTGGLRYATETTDGNFHAWRELWQAVRAGVEDNATYLRLQGLDPDGTRCPDHPVLLDVDNLIDYMLGIFFTGDEDRGLSLPLGNNRPNNFFALRNREGDHGFKFFAQDAEQWPFSQANVGGVNTNRLGPFNGNNRNNVRYSNPQWIHQDLMANEEYRVRFGDRAHAHFFNGGTLTSESATRLFLDRAQQTELAIIAESARWGDSSRPSPLTKDDWEAAVNRMVNEFFAQRSPIVVNQLKQSERFSRAWRVEAPLYPAVVAPTFSRHGGHIGDDFRLSMSAPETWQGEWVPATVYYTLNGADPRLSGGAVSSDAVKFAAENGPSTVLVPEGAIVRVYVPGNGGIDEAWMDADFEDDDWTTGTTGMGFERMVGFEDLIGTDLEKSMFGVSASVYIRIPVTVEDPRSIASLTLRMKYDDGFVAYFNGVRVASANAPGMPTWKTTATGSHSDEHAVVFQDFEASAGLNTLRVGQNVLAIHGLNASASSEDFLIVPELRSSTTTTNLRLERSTLVRARTHSDGEWSALNEAVFAVDSSTLRVTEIMYHPTAPGHESPYAREDFEYIEFQNTGDRPLNLTGIRFIQGVGFTFPDTDASPEDDLAPGEVVLVVKNLDAFTSRYDTRRMRIAGEYSGQLSNGGEVVAVVDRLQGEPLLDFVYTDTVYPTTDGLGHSLEIRDPTNDRSSWSDPESWTPSAEIGGSPGVVSPRPGNKGALPGDVNSDGVTNISDVVWFLRSLFIQPGELPCDGKPNAAGNMALLDVNGDTGTNATDALALLDYLFRTGAPPALGTRCILIIGCPNVCER